jgi:hypothetical protein
MRLRCCCCFGKEKNELSAKRFVNLKACKLLVDEKLKLKNFLHDAMDFHAVRQLMVKSRHKILMPTLVLHLTKTKLNQARSNRSSCGRNLDERTDEPVFTIEDAVSQLKTNDPSRTEVEKAMDEFFMTHLPEEVIAAAKDNEKNELDENGIIFQRESKILSRRHRNKAELTNGPQRFNGNKSPFFIRSNVGNQKSDLELASMDSSKQVAKLARRSEITEKIGNMRTTKPQYRGSIM